MKSLSQSQVKRLTAVHGWSGTLLGLLLYAVVLTGTVVVFAEEISYWSVGGERVAAPLEGGIHDKVAPIAEQVTKGYRHEIGVWPNARGELMVFPHAHAKNPETGEMGDYGPLFTVDAETGEVLSRREGFVWSEPSWFHASALHQFLIELHVQLSVPEPWGLVLTGILGLAMMAAGTTGLLMHRHLIRDLFVAERPGRRLVSMRDRHVLAASWGLPFAFLLGFTGAFFSFAGTVGFPMLASIAFGGDQERMVETLFEAPVPEDATPTPLADLDAVLARSSERVGGARPIFVDISNYGRADARIGVWHDAPEGDLGYVHNIFDGTDGRFLGVKPLVGNEPSAGAFVYSLMGPLHFGNFAGVLSKAAWVGLGGAMSFVIVSGMQLWVRRRAGQRLWRGFGRAVTVVGYGLPLAILASAYAYFLSLPVADPFWWTPAGFVAAACLCIAIGARAEDGERLVRGFRRALAYGCLALPVLRMAMGGTGWIGSFTEGYGAVLSVDLVLLAGGAALLFWRARPRSLPERRFDEPLAEPAE